MTQFDARTDKRTASQRRRSAKYRLSTKLIHTGHLLALSAIYMAVGEPFAAADPLVSLTLFGLAFVLYAMEALPSTASIRRFIREVRA